MKNPEFPLGIEQVLAPEARVGYFGIRLEPQDAAYGVIMSKKPGASDTTVQTVSNVAATIICLLLAAIVGMLGYYLSSLNTDIGEVRKDLTALRVDQSAHNATFRTQIERLIQRIEPNRR